MREQGTVVLFEKLIAVERKVYHIALCQNSRGRFARITEQGNGKRIAIVIPSPGLPEVERILSGMIQADAEAPAYTAQDDRVSIPPAYSNEGNVFRVPMRG
jgi:hypothetical protein